MCSPPAPRRTPAPARCCGPAHARSTCWYSPGLLTLRERPYSGFAKLRTFRRHMAEVVIYTRDFCYYSDAARDLLTRKGVAFKEINATGNRELRREMIERANGGSTFPQIFIGETHVGGCDELYAREERGKLDALLAG